MKWTLFRTPSGDVSARRIAGLWMLLYASLYATAGLLEFSEEFSFDVFVVFMGGCLTALGMTIPDQFAKLTQK